jgi:membrane-associated protein
MLFTTGVLIHTQDVLPLWLVLLTVPLAAVAGHQLGYGIGRRAGPHVFNRPWSRLLRQEHVDRSYAYFQQYGARTIVVTRFVPVARTLAPVVAGVSRMDSRTFLAYNVIGGVLWSCGVVLLGYSLGRVELVAQHVGALLGLVVAVLALPSAARAVRGRQRRRAGAAGRPGARPTGATAD